MPKSKSATVLRKVTGSGSFDERRRAARLDIPIKVRYKIKEEEKKSKDGVTKNISVGGCLFLVQEELPLNSVVELEIFLGDTESESLKLKGKILRLDRKEKGLFEYGIAFNGLSSEGRRLFADYCFAKMYQMIGLPEWPTARGK